MVVKHTFAGRLFDVLNAVILIALCIITFYPFYYVILCSVSDGTKLLAERGFMLLPKGFSLAAYNAVLKNPNILTGYRSTLFIVIVGTTINIIMTSIAAFLLTRRDFAIKNILAKMMIFTMYFSGGMIPT